jgi:hypothetical protein
MTIGNAEMPLVQDSLFPEVKAATDLESIITSVLTEKDLSIIVH